MIYDFLSEWRRYIPREKVSEFCQAIEFLRTFSPDSENGKHVLMEDLIFVNVQEYTPKDISEGAVEYHKEFIDIQTVVSGVENLYCVPIAGLKEKTPFDGANDFGLFDFDTAEATCCKLEPGNFVLLFPGEGHMPCIAAGDNPMPVKKLVLKIHRSIFGL
jgi:YhcH/YjgK/YiaL family protein